MCLLPRTALSRQVWCRERHVAVVEGLLQIRRRRRNRPTKSLRLVAVRRSAADSAVFGRSPSAYGAILRQPLQRPQCAVRGTTPAAKVPFTAPSACADTRTRPCRPPGVSRGPATLVARWPDRPPPGGERCVMIVTVRSCDR